MTRSITTEEFIERVAWDILQSIDDSWQEEFAEQLPTGDGPLVGEAKAELDRRYAEGYRRFATKAMVYATHRLPEFIKQNTGVEL